MATETESNLNSRRHLHPMNLRHRSTNHVLGDIRLDMQDGDAVPRFNEHVLPSDV